MFQIDMGWIVLPVVILNGKDLSKNLSGKKIFQHGNRGIRVPHHSIFYPVQQDAGHSVGIKAGNKLDLVGLEQLISPGVQNESTHQILIKIHQTVRKAILPLKLQNIDIEGLVLLHIVAQGPHSVSPLIYGHGVADQRGDLRIENPGNYIVLIPEVIVKGVPADFTVLAMSPTEIFKKEFVSRSCLKSRAIMNFVKSELDITLPPESVLCILS